MTCHGDYVSRKLPAGRVDVGVSVQTEAVVADLVHEEVGLKVETAATKLVCLRSIKLCNHPLAVGYKGDLRLLVMKAGVCAEE